MEHGRQMNAPFNLPKSADVIIVGGGIVGCSIAYYLCKRGMKPLVLEKNHKVAWEQSGRNWGFVRQLGRDPLELPMMIRSNRLWCGLEKELGQPMGWQQHGILGMTDDNAVVAHYEEWQDIARQHDVETKVLSGAEVAALAPGMNRNWSAGVYVPNDGNADPELATAAIASGVVRDGGAIVTNCAVVDVEHNGGRITGVVAEHENTRHTVKSSLVVCAAGAWSSTIADWLGISLPQLRLRATVARTETLERTLIPASWTPTMGFVQRWDGCFNLAALDISDHDIRVSDVKQARYFLRDYRENRSRVQLRLGGAFFRDLWGRLPGTEGQADPLHRARIGNPRPNPRRVNDTLKELRALYPQFRDVALKKAWAGYIEITPDMLPVIEAGAGPDGFVIVTGLSGHGFGIGPGVGETVADLVAGRKTGIDLSPFRLGRFEDGTWSAPYNLI